jgi:hypothetical protein
MTTSCGVRLCSFSHNWGTLPDMTTS